MSSNWSWKKLSFLWVAVFLYVSTSLVGATEIQEIRSRQSTEALRIVIDADAPVEYKEDANENQTELKLFVSGDVALKSVPQIVDSTGQFARSIEIKKKDDGVEFRIKFSKASAWEIFSLKNPNRLVLDLKGSLETEESWDIAKGVKYRYHRFLQDGRPVIVYITEIEKGAANIFPVLAYDELGNRETVSSMARRNDGIVAINGGYFSNSGEYIGNLKIDGEWVVGTSQERTAWGFTEKGASIVDSLGYKGRITADSLPGWSASIDGVNTIRSNDQLIIYNYRRGQTTGSNEWGKEIVVENNKITSIQDGNSAIYPNEQVVSVHGKEKEMIECLAPGEKVKIECLVDPKWDRAQSVISAGPRLVDQGKVKVTSRQEEFPADISVGRAPRTAIGETKEGTIWLVVVDGRSSASVGMTLEELANYLAERKIYNAMNLDGGGSSEMVVEDEIKNNPSDGRERPVGSGIVVSLKTKKEDSK